MKAGLFEDDDSFNMMGFAIDLIDPRNSFPDPFDAGTLFDKIILEDGPAPIINLSTITKAGTIGSGNFAHTGQIPSNIVIQGDDRPGVPVVDTYSSGSEVDHQLSVDSDFSLTYMGVSVSGSVNYSNKSNFKQESSYGFQRFLQKAYLARFRNTHDFLNPNAVKDAIALPNWNANDPSAQLAYGAWFHKYGTHVVESVTYGWSFQLQVECSKFENSSSESLKTYIKAEFLQDSASLSVLTSTDQKNYSSHTNVKALVKGGDTTAAAVYENDPQNGEKRADWAKTIATKSDEVLTDVVLRSIGDIFGVSTLLDVQSAGLKLNAALAPLGRICRRHCMLTPLVMNDASFQITSDNCTIDTSTLRIVPGGGGTLTPTPDHKSFSWSFSPVARSNAQIQFDIITEKVQTCSVHLHCDVVITPKDLPNPLFPFGILSGVSLQLLVRSANPASDPLPLLETRIGPQLVNARLNRGNNGFDGDFTFDVKPEAEYWWVPPKAARLS